MHVVSLHSNYKMAWGRRLPVETICGWRWKLFWKVVYARLYMLQSTLLCYSLGLTPHVFTTNKWYKDVFLITYCVSIIRWQQDSRVESIFFSFANAYVCSKNMHMQLKNIQDLCFFDLWPCFGMCRPLWKHFVVDLCCPDISCAACHATDSWTVLS